MKTEIVRWANRSPQERDQIEQDRAATSYATPFKGKNRAQRRRLENGFFAMQSARNRRMSGVWNF